MEFVFGADPANEVIQFRNTVEEANISQPLDSTGPVEFVHIEADVGNSDVVFIGGSEVNATNGFPLKRGSSMGLMVNDSALVYIVSAAANQVVHVVGGGFHLDDPPVSDIVATGGTISTFTQDNGVQFRVHTFTGVTIFDVTEVGWADVLIVGGGGGGGADGGGGGGGGGVVQFKRRIFSAEPYQVIVGAGGAGAEYPFIQGTRGTNSSIVQQADLVGAWPELNVPHKEIAKFGGGGGGGETGDEPVDAPEDLEDNFPANGGGGGQPGGKGFQGVSGLSDGSSLTGWRMVTFDGFKGGDSGNISSSRSGGGGAGSSQDGQDGPSGHGGKGIQLKFTDEHVSFGGGGGGSGEATGSGYGTGGAAGDGGQGGGGGGGSNRGSSTGGSGGGDAENAGSAGSSATNTSTTSGGSAGGAGGQFSGGGGGGGSSGRGVGGNGGSGRVIIKYRIV